MEIKNNKLELLEEIASKLNYSDILDALPTNLAESVKTEDRSIENVLDHLSKSDITRIRMIVASDPRTSWTTLSRLVKDKTKIVRAKALLHPNTSPDDLCMRKGKDNIKTLLSLVSNPNTPDEVLDEIAELDESHYAIKTETNYIQLKIAIAIHHPYYNNASFYDIYEYVNSEDLFVTLTEEMLNLDEENTVDFYYNTLLDCATKYLEHRKNYSDTHYAYNNKRSSNDRGIISTFDMSVNVDEMYYNGYDREEEYDEYDKYDKYDDHSKYDDYDDEDF